MIGAWYDPRDWVSSAADVVTSAANRAADAIPGGAWIRDAAKAGAGLVGKLADTVPGQIVLTAVSNGLYGPLAGQLGPQVASAVWAIPGVARGDSFAHAYVTEWCVRVKKVAEILGGEVAAKAVEALGPAVEYLKSIVPADVWELPWEEALKRLEAMGITPENVASRLGIRPDAVAAAINGMLGHAGAIPLDPFDLATGRRLSLQMRDAAKLVHRNYFANPVVHASASLVPRNLEAKLAWAGAPKPAPVPAPAPPAPAFRAAAPTSAEGPPWLAIAAGVAAVGAGAAWYALRK